MTRRMIDATHNGLADAMTALRSLGPDDLIAVYDTGSGGIAINQADMNALLALPNKPRIVAIDQGYGNSPNYNANIRDCENGAWLVGRAVDKSGWHVPRPMLYLGYPETAASAYNAGWRGDVWLVRPSNMAPTTPPSVPDGLNVVAVQWNFNDPNYDESVVFDSSWPLPENPVNTPIPAKATIPPGQWNDPQGWAWKDVIITGVGLDGNLYTYAFDPATGQWERQSLPGVMRD